MQAYLSILYLRFPEEFYIILRGKSVVYHSIANDLKFPEFILYKPHNVEVWIYICKFYDDTLVAYIAHTCNQRY